jgi:hypothetical protein
LVDGRADLEQLFSSLLAVGTGTAKTLDLIGHSAQDCLLQLGDWLIDATRPSVAAYFRGLADNDVLPRLGVTAVRLLGCHTAGTKRGRETIRTLARILGVEVYGATNFIGAMHYDAGGFVPAREYLLVASGDLQRPPTLEPASELVDRYPRLLDVDALPAMPLPTGAAWPVRLATGDDARTILGCVKRDAGATMPGMLAAPSCEIAIPAGRAGMYHRLQLVLDGAFVRVYPDGDERPGVLFPIDDPRGLSRFVAALHSITQRTPIS